MKKWIVLAIMAAQFAAAQDMATMMISEGKSKITLGVHQWDSKLIYESKALFERAGAVDPNNAWAMYWQGFANYRLAIFALYTKDADEKTGKQFIEDAVALLEKAVAADPKLADAYALLGSLTGMKIQFNPLSGMWLGPKSQDYFTKAIEADNKNPRVFYLKAIGTMNTPSMFGGGADKAIPEFDKAIALFIEESRNPPTNTVVPTWGLEECYSFRGNAFEKQDMNDKAKESYQKALEINPDSKRAKNELARVEKKK